MKTFLREVGQHHKFDAFIITFSATFTVLDVILGSYFWAVIQGLLTVLLVALAAWSWSSRKRHEATMARLRAYNEQARREFNEVMERIERDRRLAAERDAAWHAEVERRKRDLNNWPAQP